MGQKHVCHRYMGHNFMGHNYITCVPCPDCLDHLQCFVEIRRVDRTDELAALLRNEPAGRFFFKKQIFFVFGAHRPLSAEGAGGTGPGGRSSERAHGALESVRGLGVRRRHAPRCSQKKERRTARRRMLRGASPGGTWRRTMVNALWPITMTVFKVAFLGCHQKN